MTLRQRKAHLLIWTVLGPLLIVLIVLGVSMRRPIPISANDHTLNAVSTADAGPVSP